MNFSIVIPFYKNMENIYTLKSTLNDYKNDPNVEIIIIEDSANIEDFKSLKNIFYYFNNVIVLQNQQNRGPSYSRMRGVENSKGDYVFFLDADDGWIKHKAYYMYNYCVSNDIDLAGAKAAVITTESFDYVRNLDHTDKFKVKKINIYNSIFFNPFTTSSVCVKRSKILQNAFDLNMKYAEDIDCWRRILLINTKAVKLDFVDTYRFKHPYISNHGLSSNLEKMTKGSIYSLRKLVNSEKASLSVKAVACLGILVAPVKSQVRRIRKNKGISK